MNEDIFRGVLLAILLTSLAVVAGDFAARALGSEEVASAEYDSEAVSLVDASPQYHPENLTVVTSVSGAISSAQEKGSLFVIRPNGEIVLREFRYNIYDDVDPSPEGRSTVTYVAAVKLTNEQCSEVGTSPCTRNFIERLNFSTGERERLYSEISPHITDSRWHDADRINETHFAIADIGNERLIVVNVTSGNITYEWDLESAFDRNTTGAQDDPNDWAHLNDVERLRDGTYMLSPRNHDQVIFVKPGEGLLESRTLGVDENHSILYEQHNPDYLYGDDGTDSVLVADSQNNRIVEYEWKNESWNRTWVWSDSDLRWPRDADRLPNGNTLVGDTSGDRIIEVAPNGTVLWGVKVDGNYDAERLGTSDESKDGPPMSTINTSRDQQEEGSLSVLPEQLRPALNGVLFVAPAWMSVRTIVTVCLAILTSVLLIGLEGYQHYR